MALREKYYKQQVDVEITESEFMARYSYTEGLTEIPLNCPRKLQVSSKSLTFPFSQQCTASVAETGQLHRLIIKGLH
jgi:hypothetical protein